MSLDTTQRAATRRELASNLALSGRTEHEICVDLALTPQQLRAALEVEDPVLTWLLRDYLQGAVRATGGTPAPYTVLTDRARRAASVWFDLRPVPAARTAADPMTAGGRA